MPARADVLSHSLHMPTLRDIGEDDLIHRLTKDLPMAADVRVGPGDDCAVVTGSFRNVLLKADAIIEGIHFLPDAPPELIGRKALARAVSDIVAMGGLPRFALVTVVLRNDAEVAWVERLYRGLRELADEFAISIVGGETCRGPLCMISVALSGVTTQDTYIERSSASAGDALFVTGRLGGSISGHHLTFTPRLKEALWLMENAMPNAMMDVSDGLAKDLPRLAKASGLEFIVKAEDLPCTPGCTPAQAWADGEDYELLFSIAPDKAEALIKSWPFDTCLTRIGSLVPVGEGCPPKLDGTGWDHFSKA